MRHASEQVSDVTLGGVRQTAILKNDSGALELISAVRGACDTDRRDDGGSRVNGVRVAEPARGIDIP